MSLSRLEKIKFPPVFARLCTGAAVFLCLFCVPSAATAQNLENMLDQVSGSFSNAQPQGQVPGGQPAPGSGYGYGYRSAPYAPQYNMGGPPRQVNYPTQGWAQSAPPSYLQQNQVMQQVQSNGFANASPLQRLRTIYGGGNLASTSPAPAANPRQSLLHIFFGDGNSSSSSSGQNAADQASKLETAQENLSTARNQEQRAENAASRTSYGSDMSARRSAASEARYAARAARLAADRASSAGYSGGPAGDVAAQARGAADNAQAAADRADSNASGGGW